MQDMAAPETSFLSPKRKRDTQDSFMTDAPSLSRLRTANLPVRPLIQEELRSEGSPRANVAGHLQGLDLDSPNEIPRLDFNNATELYRNISSTSFASGTFSPHISLPNQTYNGPATPAPTSDCATSAQFNASVHDRNVDEPLEIPETPRLRPVASPSPPPSALKVNPPKSPPPTPATPTLWWSDSEITGHDPKDPTDDGYGINGIGFLPTPAIANARAGKRRKQVAEWKSREARDARQKRSDRRRRRDLDIGTIGNPLVHNANESRVDKGRRVRFLEV